MSDSAVETANEHSFGVVVLLGPPNAGKSTLLNSLLGQKVAIVSPKPQTTRNRISGILSDERGQVVFLDTPGVHAFKGRMNQFLNREAWNSVDGADAIVVIVDAHLYLQKPQLMDKELAPLAERVAKAAQPVFVAVNKVDKLADRSMVLPLMERLAAVWPGAELFPISAAKGLGQSELLDAVRSVLPQGPSMFPEDQISTMPLRFMAAEIVREKLFLSLRQELPYSTAVEIEAWEEEPERGFTRIDAVIFVARDNHKAMVIGKGGKTLKAVGSAARSEIMELLEGRVHLELWVKVRRDWTEDAAFLRTLGLGEE